MAIYLFLPWNPSHSHGEIKITSGAGDLANADATTNTNKANGAPATLSLSATISHYFISGMMPESASPVRQPQTIVEFGHIEAAGTAPPISLAVQLIFTQAAQL